MKNDEIKREPSLGNSGQVSRKRNKMDVLGG